MPTVSIDQPVTLEQTAEALKDKLGTRYQVTTHGSGPKEGLKVSQSIATTATVHRQQDGNVTTFHIHGGGLIIGRIMNEMGIAKKVAAALQDSLGQPSGDQVDR